MDDITPSNSRRIHRVDITASRRMSQHPRKPPASNHHQLQTAAPYQAPQKPANLMPQSLPTQHKQPTTTPLTHTSTQQKPTKKFRKTQLTLPTFHKRSSKYAAGESSNKSKLRTSKRTRVSSFAAAMFVLVVGTGLLFLYNPKASAGTPNMQGPKTATASGDCTNDASTGTVAWTSPGNAFSSNDTYATAAVNGTTSNYIKCVNYGFSIPTSATVNGIIITVERKSSGTNDGGVTDAAVRAVKGGVIGSTDKSTATAYTTSDVSEDHGSSSELWGTTWTPADINGATFGAAVAAKKVTAGTSLTASVDLVTITVHYTISSNLDLSSYRWFENNGTGVTTTDYTFAQTFGGNTNDTNSVSGSNMTKTNDGGFIFSGESNSRSFTDSDVGSTSAFLSKYDNTGNEQWTKTWGATTSSTYSSSVVQTSDGGYITSGRTSVTGFTAGLDDHAIVKYNSSGVEQWTKTWGGTSDDGINQIIQTTDGGYAIVGYTSSTGFTAGSNDIVIAKYNSSGVEQWTKTWGGTGSDYGTSIVQTSDGNYFVTGYSNSTGLSSGTADAVIIKFNSSGIEQWSKSWGGTATDNSFKIIKTADGGFCIVGQTASTEFATASNDQFIQKYNSSGVEQWTKTWGGNGSDSAYSVTETSDSGFIVVGSTSSTGFTSGSDDATIVKYDSSGVEQWTTTWGGSASDIARQVIQLDMGDIIVAGDTNTMGAGNTDNFILRMTSNGTITNCADCIDRSTSETNHSTNEVDRTATETDRAVTEVDRTNTESNRDGIQLMVHCGVSNQFIKTWGGSDFTDNIKSMEQDSNGNIYAVGFSGSTPLNSGALGTYDEILVKYNSEGVIQWTKTWGGTGVEQAYDLKLDSSGNIYIVGQTSSTGLTSGSVDQTLVKYNSSGIEQWSKTWGGAGVDQAWALELDSSGNIYVVGESSSTGFTAGGLDQTLVKYNSSGVEQWSKTWGGATDDSARGIKLDQSGNIYVVGYTSSTGFTSGSNDQTLIKYNSSGVLQWMKTVGSTTQADYASSLALDSSGNIYVVGDAGVTLAVAGQDQTLIKYNSSGVVQWAKIWGGTGSDVASDIAFDSNGNIYVTGQTASTEYVSSGSASFTNDQTLVMYNSSGIEQWSRTFGGNDNDYAASLVISNTGYVFVGGYFSSRGLNSSGNTQNSSLIKVNPAESFCNGACSIRSVTETNQTVAEVNRTATEVDRTATEVDRANPDTVRNQYFEPTVNSGAVVGSPLNSVAQNTSTTAPTTGTPFRLRFTSHVSNADLAAGDLTLKLQYAVMFDTCDTSFGGETYYDIGASTPISYYDNTSLADRYSLLSNANDPVHSGHSNIMQQYGESAGFGVSNAVTSASDGLWDVALTTVSPAGSTTYCIRAVTYSGNLLSSYTAIPAITTPDSAPDAPTLQLPANGTTAVSTTPEFRFGSLDGAGDYLRYKIEVCSNSDCSTILRTIDQTASQTGWIGQSRELATAYNSSSSIIEYAIHQYQTPQLTANTQYWWRAYAIDPGGTNTWSDASAIWSFTTQTSATPKQVIIKGNTNIGGDVKISP